jgi:signal peptidase I
VYSLFLIVFAVYSLSVLSLLGTIEMDKQTNFHTVKTASMEPTLKIGDKLALKSIFTIDCDRYGCRMNPDEISAAPSPDGDIVYAFLYRELPQDREYVLSRVVEKYQVENGTWYLITQVDTSESYDSWSPFPLSWVKGKVVAVNPIMPFYFPLFTPLLFVLTISGGCSCIIMVYILHKERQ